MSKNKTRTKNVNDVLDGEKLHADYIAAVKKNKLKARLAFAAAMVGVVIIAIKYVHTPVPEWADDSEDV